MVHQDLAEGKPTILVHTQGLMVVILSCKEEDWYFVEGLSN